MWPFKRDESTLKAGTVAGIGGVLAAAGAAVWYLLGRKDGKAGKDHGKEQKKGHVSHAGHGKGDGHKHK